jgi:hypothetical protein
VNAASPDVTCALSFSGQANKDPLDDLIKPQSLPDIELTKLDGPASIVGDSLQISVYNGSGWALREITVGFTVVRRHIELAAELGEFRLMPAAISSPVAAEKPPDVTLLYHMKGTAAPSSTTVFQAPLDVTLEPDQEWHWAIVQAKGIPPASAPELPAEPKIQAPN